MVGKVVNPACVSVNDPPVTEAVKVSVSAALVSVAIALKSRESPTSIMAV
ncbi:MAG: hypothetical protein O7H41_04455 [Planctomycetota bacterium]|nr:hypothetical protein [Planctomycetota bacterium]